MTKYKHPIIEPPLQNSTIVNPTTILVVLTLIYYFQGQKLISSNAVLNVVLQCSETIFLTRKKKHSHSLNLKAKLVFAFCYSALIFKFEWPINSLKLIVHLIILKNSQQHSKMTCIVSIFTQLIHYPQTVCNIFHFDSKQQIPPYFVKRNQLLFCVASIVT